MGHTECTFVVDYVSLSPEARDSRRRLILRGPRYGQAAEGSLVSLVRLEGRPSDDLDVFLVRGSACPPGRSYLGVPTLLIKRQVPLLF